MKGLQFNIRQKIIVGFLLPSVFLGILTAFSYYNLKLIEQKTAAIEHIDDLENIILEFRRQEKNFLLYGENESYNLAKQDGAKALAMLDKITLFGGDAQITALIASLRGSMRHYLEQIDIIYGLFLARDRRLGAETEELRTIGKDLVIDAQRVSTLERDNIFKVNQRLKSQLLFSTVGVSGLFLIMFLVISTRVLKPLKTIELATLQIAEGKFQPLPVRNANDEIQKVQIAFNRMVRELEKRQDQLVQAQKLSSIGTLAAGIAHQVNNPLNNISTSAQILQDLAKDADADPFALKMIDNIEKETARARDIVRGLLEFSRQQDFSMRLVALADVVNRAVRLVSSQVPPDVSLHVDVPATIEVRLDPHRMGEALINLLINAIQAIETPPGEIRIFTLPGREGRVVLAVQDSGKGIPEEDLQSIFDPFFTSKEVGEGTGLGLFIVYGIIEKCGGSIRVESAPGTGARFLIDLPAAGMASDLETPGERTDGTGA
ncbi:MAG: ATP-binding protein [Desulfovibrionaceae bacterium]